MQLICQIVMYAVLHILLICHDMLIFVFRVTSSVCFLTEDTNGTLAYAM